MSINPQFDLAPAPSAEPSVHPDAEVKQCRLGRFTAVGARTLMEETELGDYSYIVNDGEVIYAQIGKFCSIAAQTRLNPGNHPMWRASQSHFTYRASRYFSGAADEAAFFEWRRAHPVTIGHDVWIGHGAVVLPGVRIGTGSVVAAGAVVTRDVEPYMIAAGVPAKPLRRRFPARIAERMAEIGWWDWDHDTLYSRLEDIRSLDAEDFIEKFG